MTDSFYSPVLGPNGEFLGIWVADMNHPNLRARLEMYAVGNSLGVETFGELQDGIYRAVPNTVNDAGGHFLMLRDHLAPGEEELGEYLSQKSRQPSRFLDEYTEKLTAIGFTIADDITLKDMFMLLGAYEIYTRWLRSEETSPDNMEQARSFYMEHGLTNP